MGFFTGLMNLCPVFLQLAMLRRKFPKEQYLQIPVSLVFGTLIDVWMHIVPLPATMTYEYSLLYLAAGTLVLAFGVFVEVSANVVVIAEEGAVLVLATVLRREFGAVKTVFDSTLVLLAVLLSFALFGELRGVRKGSPISAVSVGFIARFFFRLRDRLKKARTIVKGRSRHPCRKNRRRAPRRVRPRALSLP